MPHDPSQRLVQAVLLLLVASAEAWTAVATDEQADLRGYGQVEAAFAPGQAVFRCADPEHADLLLGKLLADLFWDAGAGHVERRLEVAGTPVPIHAWKPYGVLAVARVGSQVLAVGAADDASLRAALRQRPELVRGTPAFAPEKPYPRYLDHYDLRSFKSYTGAMKSQSELGLASHWPFIKRFGLGGIAFQSLAFDRQSPAPGVISFTSADYEVREAERQNGVVAIGLGASGEIPLWLYNQAPDGAMQPSPTTLIGGWNGTGPAGAHYESWWMPPGRRIDGTLNFTRLAMERYRSSPALSAWHLYAGSPGAEVGFHDRSGAFWDYSPVGVAGFRAWLRDERKLDLAQLGLRWHGDARRFTGWEQVQIPDPNEFFGGTDPSSVRLAEGWQWASARTGIADPPAADDPAWVAVAMPPSQQQDLLPWGEAFFRVGFASGEWLAKPQAWLACGVLNRTRRKPLVCWLNGEPIKIQDRGQARPFAIPLAGRLKAGRNELIIRVPRLDDESESSKEFREGKLFGPIYLTAVEPRSYPDLGAQGNARYVDLKMWQSAGVGYTHRVVLDTALAIDPDHPFNLSGSAGDGAESMNALAEEYGATLQHTGRASWYHPWWPGIGLLGGFYGTSEEAGTASAESLTRELGWILLDGDSNHNLYHDLEAYQLEERRSGWFSTHQRAIQCFGKYLRAMPQVAVLRSGRDILLGGRGPWDGDLGTGELQASHVDNAYATEVELLKGLTDACPVLFDAGTESMDDDVIQALRRYVERGGTFIAREGTGRHSSIVQDAQPLARLSGLRATWHPAGKLRIATGAPLLSAWAGREFSGAGMTLTPLAGEEAGAGEAPMAVATWADGGMAIAVRRVGKGRVIQLGSAFWRNHGPLEWEFLERLLGDLGVVRTADASDPGIWARKATTKNGLQDWLLTYNVNGKESRTADVRLAVSDPAVEVWDLLSGAPVAATVADGFATIPAVRFAPLETRLYAVRRAGLVEGLAFWWGEKTRYWRRPPAASSPAVIAERQRLAAAPAVASPDVIDCSTWRFRADRDGSLGEAWLAPGFDDQAWSRLDTGPWNLQDPALADWHGVGAYRRSFNVPAAWSGRRVILDLYDFDRPIVYDHGAFAINGTPVADYQAHVWSQAYAYDVTDLLRPGGNVLTVRVQGGTEFSGICGSVWLQPELRFAAQLDLAGTWELRTQVSGPAGSAVLPGEPRGRCLQRDLDLPAAWNGRTVYLHLESASQWLGCVAINGRLINLNGYLHPFPPRSEINLTPYLVPGRNRLELWAYKSVPTNYEDFKPFDIPMPVGAVRLGLIDARP